MKKVLLFLLGVLLALPCMARDFKYEYEGHTLTYTVIDEEAKTCMTKEGWDIDPGNYVSGDLIIPSVAKDNGVEYTVTSIGYRAFYLCRGLTSVTIPNSVTTIFGWAFRGCSGLTSVTIPNSVTTIYGLAFEGCSGLTSVIIPNLVTSMGNSVFDGCTGLKKSAYPSVLSNPFHAGEAVAYNPDGAIIEDGWIYGPEKKSILFAPFTLTGEFTIPNSVTSIGESAFERCSGLTSVTIPNSVTSIGPAAFCFCFGLTSVKALPKVPPTMPSNAFAGLYTEVKLLVADASVEDYLTTNWSLFDNISLATSGKEITTYSDGVLKYRLIPAVNDGENNLAVVIPGDYSSLTEVTIPYRFAVEAEGADPVRYYVDAIGYQAFNGCSKLASVSFHNRNTLKVIGNLAFYGCGFKTIDIPETVEKIDNYAFFSCSSLTEITIPGSVKTIGDYAFSRTSSLNKVTLNEDLESIGSAAFRNCSSLKEITIPGSVKTIGDYAFYGISSLKKVTLNEGLESIGESAFSASRDRNIEPLYIPSTLKSVGQDAFYDFNCEYVNIKDLAAWCKIDFANENSNPSAHRKGLYLNGVKIENLVIPESISSVKDYAFCYNSSLKSVTFHDALQSIGNGAFLGTNISTLTIPGSVTEIGDRAFSIDSELTFAYGAASIKTSLSSFGTPKTVFCDRPMADFNLSVSSLETLTIGNSVAEIPAGKFKDASNLTELTLGSNLTAIGDEAFSGCTSLKEVTVPPSVETIGASAFAGNSKLALIVMGHSVKTIGEKAFDGCPASTVSITAQTPPTAPNNTFSNYTGKLYVQGEKAIDAYLDAYTCWDRFNGAVMIEATSIDMGDSPTTLSGKPGDTFQLTAKLMPEDVTLPQVFWRSTNPEIATVDQNGLVTLHADLSEVMAQALATDEGDNTTCKIIAESLYANGPVTELEVNVSTTGIDDVVTDKDNGEIDFSAPVEVYNLQGVMVAESMSGLDAGIYIVRQGKTVKKIAIR